MRNDCTGAGTHNFQIASERLQYRLKWHVLGHVRPPSTLQNFQYSTVRSRYKRQLIRLNMKKKWPTRTGMEDMRPIFSFKRFSSNENALYRNDIRALDRGAPLHSRSVDKNCVPDMKRRPL